MAATAMMSQPSRVMRGKRLDGELNADIAALHRRREHIAMALVEWS